MLPLGVRRQGCDRPRLRPRRQGGGARHPLSALPSRAAGDLRDRRRRRFGDRPGDAAHDLPGARRTPHPLRPGSGVARAEDPDHHPGHRRRLRQQGADLPRLRGGDGGVAAHRQAGEVGGGPLREPDLHRLRPRLPHERADGARRDRADDRAAGEPAQRQRRLLRRRPAHQVPGGALPHRHRLVRHPHRTHHRRRLLHQQGAGRRRLPLLLPGDRGVVHDRAAGGERRHRAR